MGKPKYTCIIFLRHGNAVKKYNNVTDVEKLMEYARKNFSNPTHVNMYDKKTAKFVEQKKF